MALRQDELVTFRLPSHLARDLQRVVEREFETRSVVIRRLLRKAIDSERGAV